jgi:hypothetical protein
VITSRIICWKRHVALKGDRRGAERVWVVRYKGQRPLGRPRRRWEDKIKTDHQEVARGHALD